MLAPDKIARLKFHAAQIAVQLILQIQPDGKIHSVYEDKVYEDLVSEHHIIEVLSGLDTRILNYYADAVLTNMVQTQARPYHPFVLDSLASVPDLIGDKQLSDLIEQEVAPQLANGAITKYTAYMDGGNYFSTLWAVKILLKVPVANLIERTRKAVEYLVHQQEIEATTISQAGFLLWILGKYQPESYLPQIRSLAKGIIDRSDNTPYLWYSGHAPLTSTIFVLQDLLVAQKYLDNWPNLSGRIETTLSHIFELDHDLDHLPSVITQELSHYAEALRFETLSQAVVLVGLYLASQGDTSLPYAVNKLLQQSLAQQNFKLRYDLTLIDQEYKTYLSLYQEMHQDFKHYDDILGVAWKDAPLRQSIFIMMPFRFEEQTYRTIRDEIKRAAQDEDFQAFIASDRPMMPTLWDNLVANMLSCQYGIAVVTPDHILNAMETHADPLILHNPNVALEFGFMVSRGMGRVLLLTHDLKALPADLRGFLVEEFDIKNPDQGIYSTVRKWLQQLKEKERKRQLGAEASKENGAKK